MVGGVLEFTHQMAGDEDRPAFGGEMPEQAPDPLNAFGIKAVDRLVEQKHRWVAEQRDGYPDPLAHTEGVTARPPPGRLLHPDLFEHLVHPPHRQPVGVCEPAEVVAPPPAGVQGGGVQQGADLQQRGTQGVIGAAADQRLSPVGGVQPQHGPHGGGLPRPVGADEPGHRAGLDRERQPVDRERPPEPLAQLPDFDGCVGCLTHGEGG